MRVPIDTERSFAPGTPEVLSEGPFLPGTSGFGNNYDLAPDGQRFLMIKEEGGTASSAPAEEITVVLNWFEELRRLVPTP